MKLDNRKEHILDFIVRDYIATAQPVSSGRMALRRVLDSSSATLRNIMLELDEGGFLFQPHTSAGRAPTEKGYRYFIDNMIGKPKASSNFSEFSADALGSFVNDFAHDLGIFASAMITGEKNMRELAGFRDVLLEPEFREEDMLENFGRMVDEIDSVMGEYQKALIKEDNDYNVWIGRENIYPGARKGSTLVARISMPEENEMIFFAYGPTRMNYEKAIFKLKNLIDEI